jgi:hypothetical protein
MKAFADECGVDFIDYNLMHEEIGIDWTTDFLDTVHLNETGRSKLSTHIGKYLVDNYELVSHEDSAWDEDAELYDQACKADKMQRTSNATEWFELATDMNYSICLNGNINCLSEEKQKLLKLQKIENRADNLEISAYICNEDDSLYYSSDEPITQETIAQEPESEEVYIGNQEISIRGMKYTTGTDKCRLVVYDNVLHKIVDSVSIDANGNLDRNES